MSIINTFQNTNAAAAALKAASKDSPAKVKKALQDFESLFINQMLSVMRQTVGKNTLFGGGSGEKVYSSLFDAELSKLMARGGGIGITDMMMEQFNEGSNAAMAKAAADAPQGGISLDKALKNR